MSGKDDLIVLGAVGVGAALLVTLAGGSIKSFFKILGLEKEVDALEDKIDEIKEERGSQYDALSGFYGDAVDTINDLNQQIGDLTNQIQNTVETGGSAVMTVSDAITDLPSVIPDIAKTTRDASDTISKIIADAGGVVSSGTEEAAKIIEQIKKIKVWQVPGWMPVGEV